MWSHVTAQGPGDANRRVTEQRKLTTEDEHRHEPHGGLDARARGEHNQMTLAESGDPVKRHPVEHMVTGALWSTSWRRQKKKVYLKRCAESKRHRGHPSRCTCSPKRPLSARGCQEQLHSGDHRDTHILLRTSGPINCPSHVVAAIMVSSKMIFENRQHPLPHLGRFLVFAEFCRGLTTSSLLQSDPGQSAAPESSRLAR